MTTPPRRFDLAMRTITYPALLILAGLPLAGLWDLATWPTIGRIAISTIVLWIVLGALAALTWNRSTHRD